MQSIPEVRKVLRWCLDPDYTSRTIATSLGLKPITLDETKLSFVNYNPIEIILHYLFLTPEGIREEVQSVINNIFPLLSHFALQTIIEYTRPRYPTPIETLIQEITRLPSDVVATIFDYKYSSVTVYSDEVNIPGKPLFAKGTPGQLAKDLARGLVIKSNGQPIPMQELDRAHSQEPTYLPIAAAQGLNKLLPKISQSIREFLPMRGMSDVLFVPESTIYYQNGKWRFQAFFHINKFLFRNDEPIDESAKKTKSVPGFSFIDTCLNPYGNPEIPEYHTHNTRFVTTWIMNSINSGYNLDTVEIYSEMDTPDEFSANSAIINTLFYRSLFTENATIDEYRELAEEKITKKLEEKSQRNKVLPTSVNDDHPIWGIVNLYLFRQFQDFLENTRRSIVIANRIIQNINHYREQHNQLAIDFRDTYCQLFVINEEKQKKANSNKTSARSISLHRNTSRSNIYQIRVQELIAEIRALETVIDTHYFTMSSIIRKLQKPPQATHLLSQTGTNHPAFQSTSSLSAVSSLTNKSPLSDEIRDRIKIKIAEVFPKLSNFALNIIAAYAHPRYQTSIEQFIQEITGLMPETVGTIYGYLYFSTILLADELDATYKWSYETEELPQSQKDLLGFINIDMKQIAEFFRQEIATTTCLSSTKYANLVEIILAYLGVFELKAYDSFHRDLMCYPIAAVSRLNSLFSDNTGEHCRKFYPVLDTSNIFSTHKKIFYQESKWRFRTEYYIQKINIFLKEDASPILFMGSCQNALQEPHQATLNIIWNMIEQSDGVFRFYLDTIEISADSLFNMEMYAALFTKNVDRNILCIINRYFDISQLTKYLGNTRRRIVSTNNLIQKITSYSSRIQSPQQTIFETKTNLNNCQPNTAPNYRSLCLIRGRAFQTGNSFSPLVTNNKDEEKFFCLVASHGDVVTQNNLGLCYEQGVGIHKDEQKALTLYQIAAARGDAAAQISLGICHENDTSVLAKSEEIAIELFTKAALQGDAAGQNNVGVCYLNGKHVKKDEQMAVKLFTMAANQRLAIAQNNLGLCYEQGLGVNKDEKKALKLYQVAADQGDIAGQINLGHCYRIGIGVSRNENRALELYNKATQQGNAFAQNILAICFFYGIGCIKDEQKAVKLFALAAKQGLTIAQNNFNFCCTYRIGINNTGNETARPNSFIIQDDIDTQINPTICYTSRVSVNDTVQKAIKLFGLVSKSGSIPDASHQIFCYFDDQCIGKGKISYDYSKLHELQLLGDSKNPVYKGKTITGSTIFYKEVKTSLLVRECFNGEVYKALMGQRSAQYTLVINSKENKLTGNMCSSLPGFVSYKKLWDLAHDPDGLLKIKNIIQTICVDISKIEMELKQELTSALSSKKTVELTQKEIKLAELKNQLGTWQEIIKQNLIDTINHRVNIEKIPEIIAILLFAAFFMTDWDRHKENWGLTYILGLGLGIGSLDYDKSLDDLYQYEGLYWKITKNQLQNFPDIGEVLYWPAYYSVSKAVIGFFGRGKHYENDEAKEFISLKNNPRFRKQCIIEILKLLFIPAEYYIEAANLKVGICCEEKLKEAAKFLANRRYDLLIAAVKLDEFREVILHHQDQIDRAKMILRENLGEEIYRKVLAPHEASILAEITKKCKNPNTISDPLRLNILIEHQRILQSHQLKAANAYIQEEKKKASTEIEYLKKRLKLLNSTSAATQNLSIQHIQLSEVREISFEVAYKEISNVFDQFVIEPNAQKNLQTSTSQLSTPLEFVAKDYGLMVDETKHDCKCLFHAIAAQLNRYTCSLFPVSHIKLKELAVTYLLLYYWDYLNELSELTLETLIKQIKRDDAWLYKVIAQVISQAVNINIVILRNNALNPTIIRQQNPACTVLIGHDIGVSYQPLVRNNNIINPSKDIQSLIEGSAFNTWLVTPLTNIPNIVIPPSIQKNSYNSSSSSTVATSVAPIITGSLSSFVSLSSSSLASDSAFPASASSATLLGASMSASILGSIPKFPLRLDNNETLKGASGSQEIFHTQNASTEQSEVQYGDSNHFLGLKVNRSLSYHATMA